MKRDWLIKIRTENKFTQKFVSQSAKISIGFYCDIENGYRSPSVTKAKRIAKALNFDWQKFYEDEEK